MSLKVLSRALFALAAIFAVAAVPLAAFASGASAAGSLDKINHIIVIYQENRSFDALYGEFPGANGWANATTQMQQVDKAGQPYQLLPQPLNSNLKPVGPDPRFPADLPVKPYDLSLYVAPNDKTGDMVHRFYQEQYQIDGGKMDKFVAWTDAQGLVMGYYNGTNMPEGLLAQQYTIADNFFHAAFGGSFLNHFWLICSCSPTWPNAPASKVAKLGPDGVITTDGAVTPDGYAVNTSFTINSPHPANITDTTQLVPEQTQPTIGDRLSDKGISWAWYSGGWNDAIAGNPDPLFQFHHQPFAFFANYADNTPGRAAHLRDETDFMRALQTNDLPAVSFIKPVGMNNEHPGYASLAQGQQHVADLVNAVKSSPYWADSAIIITYDENGGQWDHVAPPTTDKWGPGTRVPTIIISPYAKKGFVDHTQYDTTSILKTIEMRYDLAPLTSRDASVNPLTNAFDFGATTTPGMPTTGNPSVEPWMLLIAAATLLFLAGLALRWRWLIARAQ